MRRKDLNIEAVGQGCSVKKMFLKTSRNSQNKLFYVTPPVAASVNVDVTLYSEIVCHKNNDGENKIFIA